MCPGYARLGAELCWGKLPYTLRDGPLGNDLVFGWVSGPLSCSELLKLHAQDAPFSGSRVVLTPRIRGAIVYVPSRDELSSQFIYFHQTWVMEDVAKRLVNSTSSNMQLVMCIFCRSPWSRCIHRTITYSHLRAGTIYIHIAEPTVLESEPLEPCCEARN